MKRRRFLTTAAATPAIPAVLAQQPTTRSAGEAASTDDAPKLDVAAPDAVAESVRRTFTAAQFAALRKLSDLLQPAIGKYPGALDAKAPEFLDFWIGQSPAAKQQLYRAGLDALNAHAKRKFQKMFAELDAKQADTVLAPLHAPWTDPPPADPFARFLVEAKEDVRNATMNSKEYGAVAAAGTRRSGAGMGLYWNPIV